MRPISAGIALVFLAFPTLVAGSGAPAPKSGPAVVPYLCSDGQPASVIYESGSDYLHARAKVSYGGRTFELAAAPTLYGVRYRGESGDGAPLAWTLWGEQAWLSESPDADGYTRQERELARCVRLRGVAVASASGDQGGAHGQDHGEDH